MSTEIVIVTDSLAGRGFRHQADAFCVGDSLPSGTGRTRTRWRMRLRQGFCPGAIGLKNAIEIEARLV